MIWKPTAWIFATALVLSGCASVETPPESPPEVVDTSPPPQGPPSYATAEERHLPQAVVTGRGELAAEYEMITSPALSAAQDYAVQMQSYSFLVWQGGSLKHVEYFDPFGPTLRSESASMHKSVLALAVGAAIDRGYVGSVDEKVSKYIPEWQDDPRGEILIRELLQMTSGLAPLSSEGGIESPAFNFVFNGASVRSTILNLPLDHEPGTVFHYANAVSQLLALVIETATGTPYADFLSETVWQPISASDALVWNNEPDGFPRAYTALLATAEDWLRVGLLIKDYGRFNGEQVISQDYVEAMTQGSSANPDYGYQVWLGETFEAARFYNDAKTGFAVIASDPFLVDDMIYLDGFGGQRVYVSRSLDLVIVRMGESRPDWDDTRLPNLVIEALALKADP